MTTIKFPRPTELDQRARSVMVFNFAEKSSSLELMDFSGAIPWSGQV